MSDENSVKNSNSKIKIVLARLFDFMYNNLPIIIFCIVVCILCLIWSLVLGWQAPTKQAGYFFATSFLFLGLIGLWIENTSLFQQQVFKILVYSGIAIYILTFSFSIAIDIINQLKTKEIIKTPICF